MPTNRSAKTLPKEVRVHLDQLIEALAQTARGQPVGQEPFRALDQALRAATALAEEEGNVMTGGAAPSRRSEKSRASTRTLLIVGSSGPRSSLPTPWLTSASTGAESRWPRWKEPIAVCLWRRWPPSLPFSLFRWLSSCSALTTHWWPCANPLALRTPEVMREPPRFRWPDRAGRAFSGRWRHSSGDQAAHRVVGPGSAAVGEPDEGEEIDGPHRANAPESELPEGRHLMRWRDPQGRGASEDPCDQTRSPSATGRSRGVQGPRRLPRSQTPARDGRTAWRQAGRNEARPEHQGLVRDKLRHVKARWDRVPISALDHLDVQAWVHDMSADGRGADTVRGAHCALHEIVWGWRRKPDRHARSMPRGTTPACEPP